MEEIEVGRITHYFGHLNVAGIQVAEEIRVGDVVHIKGHTTDCLQKVESMQVEHATITFAKPGDNIGIRVNEHVREHDKVYKVIEQ